MLRKIIIASLCLSIALSTFLPVTFAATEGTSGVFVADDTRDTDEAWNILASSKPEKAYCFVNWMNGSEHGGNNAFCLASAQVNGVDTPDYWIITGGLSEGTEIKTFEVRTRGVQFLQVLGSDALDGEYTVVSHTSVDNDSENPSINVYAPKTILRYDMSGLGYRYIKLQSLATSWQDAIFGKYSYTYDEIQNETPETETPTSGETVVDFSDANTNLTFSGFNRHLNDNSCFLEDGTKYNGGNFFQGEAGSGPVEIKIHIPEEEPVYKIVVDYLNCQSSNSNIKLYASDAENGEYTMLSGNSLSSVELYNEDGTRSYYSKYTPCEFTNIPEGTKYIKLASDSRGYGENIGKIVYYWGEQSEPDTPEGPTEPEEPTGYGKVELDDFSSFDALGIIENSGFKITQDMLYLTDDSAYNDARLEPISSDAWYFLIEVPEGKTADRFVIDLGYDAGNCTKVSVSPIRNGEYTEVEATYGDRVDLSSSDGDRYISSRYCVYYTTAKYSNLPADTRYIKVELINTSATSYWSKWFGKMSYYWGDVEYYTNDTNIVSSGETCSVTTSIAPNYDDLDSLTLKAMLTVYDNNGKLLHLKILDMSVGETVTFEDVPYAATNTMQLVWLENNEGFAFPLSSLLSFNNP